ncbi:MAG: aminoacyl-tRNA hydrolase [Fimbriimonadaceae bacterium]|nr:aminoacyl-tRNA hydrolase [Fimbriimonadaceae bacterium]
MKWFKKAREPLPPPTVCIVGLGNPGAQYRGTRHNVGFEVIDMLGEKHGIAVRTTKHQALIGIGRIAGETVVLVKPLTFMNLSGRSVAPILREHSLTPDRLLVITDDLDLPVGRVRMKPKGSSGGHNGHKSLIASLGTEDYARIKIGIGRPGDATVDHVLGRFHPDERTDLNPCLKRSVQGAEAFVSQSLEAALNAVNVSGA